MLNEISVKKDDVDHYWLEVVRQCCKFDLQNAVIKAGGGFGFDIVFLPSEKFAPKHYKAGRGMQAATQGREARKHYIKLRGALPNPPPGL